MLKYESQASGLGLGEALYDPKVYALMTTYFVLVLATNIVTVGPSPIAFPTTLEPH